MIISKQDFNQIRANNALSREPKMWRYLRNGRMRLLSRKTYRNRNRKFTQKILIKSVISLSRLNRKKFLFFLVSKISQERKVQMKEKMIKKLCKYIHWYNENEEECFYHFYMGYKSAMRDLGMDVEIIRNEFVVVDGNTYKVEDYK